VKQTVPGEVVKFKGWNGPKGKMGSTKGMKMAKSFKGLRISW